MSADTWQRWPDGHPATCAMPGCGTPIAPEDPRYKKGKVILCRACGEIEVAGQYKSAPKAAEKTPALRPASELAGNRSPERQGGAAKPPEPAKAPPVAPEPGGLPEPPASRPAPKSSLPPGPDGLPSLPGVTGLGRIKIGIQWGLPGYSSVVVHVEDAAREGENLEELADRLSITVWQRLVREGAKVVAATKEPERYLGTSTEPVGEVGSD